MTDKARRIQYLKDNISFGEERDIIRAAMCENGNWDWLTEDQLADVINHLTHKWRRRAAMNRRNRARAALSKAGAL